jgi:hypothetical protein
MLVYTLLFTLANKDPKENKYVDMLLIWLTYLIKYGGLDKTDEIAVLIDTRTFAHIQEIEPLSYLVDSASCPINFVCIEPPLTLSEGMIQRYKIIKNIQSFYLDLDCIILKSLKQYIPQLKDNQFLVMPEGRLEDSNYGGLVLKGDIPPMCGFTSGWFVFYPCDEIQKFFDNIRSECLAQASDPFYTIDQPFFNKWVYLSLTENPLGISVLVMNDEIIENNSYEVKPSTVFMNYCGEPGVGAAHATKMVGLLCLQHIKSTEPYL